MQQLVGKKTNLLVAPEKKRKNFFSFNEGFEFVTVAVQRAELVIFQNKAHERQ